MKNIFYRLLILLVLLLGISAAAQGEGPVAYVNGMGYDTLAEAYAQGTDTILLADHEVITQNEVITIDRKVTIYFYDSTISAQGTATLFKVVSGGQLTLSGVGTLNRTGSKSGSAVTVSGGEFVLDGVDITGFVSGNGGAVNISSGSFIMNSGSIVNCRSSASSITGGGGAIFVSASGTATIKGGDIRDNKSGGAGGAVYNSGIFTLEGGRLEDNEVTAMASAWGGAIYNSSQTSRVVISGGVITGNKGLGGITSRNGLLEITGGAIYHNPNTASVPQYADILIRWTTLANSEKVSICAAEDMSDEAYALKGWQMWGGTTNTPAAHELGAKQAAWPLSALPDDWSAWKDSVYFTMDAEQLTPDPDPDGVYLNGVSGSDSNTGTSPSDAVLTFEKAKALALEKNQVIYVSGQVPVTGMETFSGVSLMRHFKYSGYLITVAEGGELTLSDITIHGNKENIEDNKALILVKGELNILDGAILENNHAAGGQYNYGAGAIYCDEGRVEMTGGEIRYNESESLGGGITAVHSAEIHISGGKIHENQAKEYGGGVCAIRSSRIDLSGSGEISRNIALHGGGIQLGGGTTAEAYSSGGKQTLEMTGGRLDGNIARGGTGGGLYVQMNSLAEIHAGYITNNKADETGAGAFPYRGGGIYVNGGKSYGYTDHGDKIELDDGLVQLYNVEISGNRANQAGGGIAACPTADVQIYVQQGGLIFGNSAGRGAQQIYLNQLQPDASNAQEPSAVYISDFMLGGGMYEWLWDQQDAPRRRASQQEYQYPSRQDTPYIYLDNSCHPEDVERARAGVTTFITGNSTYSDNGGGIGANGSVIIGQAMAPHQLEGAVLFQKIWADQENQGGDRPQTIRLDAQIGDYYLRGIELTAENAWRAAWYNLPTELAEQGKQADLIMAVTEAECPEYEMNEDSLTWEYFPQEQAVLIQFENRYTPTPGHLTVSKTVSGIASQDQAFQFIVTLGQPLTGVYGEMQFADGTASFELKHGESITATNLPKNMPFTVEETGRGGCTVTVNGEAGNTLEGIIIAGETAEVAFNNHKEAPYIPPVGHLKVSKTVSGEIKADQPFQFTVTLDRPLTGVYGEMQFENGRAAFSLRHGESITAADLPAGVSFTVQESHGADEMVTVNGLAADTLRGSIAARSTAEAAFHNHLEKPYQPPATGDSNPLWLWLLLMGCSGLLLGRLSRRCKG